MSKLLALAMVSVLGLSACSGSQPGVQMNNNDVNVFGLTDIFTITVNNTYNTNSHNNNKNNDFKVKD